MTVYFYKHFVYQKMGFMYKIFFNYLFLLQRYKCFKRLLNYEMNQKYGKTTLYGLKILSLYCICISVQNFIDVSCFVKKQY